MHLPHEGEPPISLAGEGRTVALAYLGPTTSRGRRVGNKKISTGAGLAIGLGVGSALTIATGDAVWFVLGIAIGAALASRRGGSGDESSPEGGGE